MENFYFFFCAGCLLFLLTEAHNYFHGVKISRRISEQQMNLSKLAQSSSTTPITNFVSLTMCLNIVIIGHAEVDI